MNLIVTVAFLLGLTKCDMASILCAESAKVLVWSVGVQSPQDAGF